MPQPANRSNRRRQFIVAKGFQHRIIWHFIGVVIISILFSHAISLGYLKLREITQSSGRDFIYLAGNAQETLAFSSLLDVLWLPLLISALVGILIIVIFGLLYSHRIAGPLFNLKRNMRQVGEGDLNACMQIRKNDELHDVEVAFNQMVKGLKNRFGEKKKQVRK
ncbi:HAMP domain-containing protein [bacterium]|nr:HAMP domain-containing protein [bacterium]